MATLEWDFALFEYFLKLKLITTEKIQKVDCQFNEITREELKALLLGAREELMRTIGKPSGILIVRKINDALTFFQIGIEDTTKRFFLNIFADSIVADVQSNLSKRKWENAIPSLSNFPHLSLKIKALLSDDFLHPNAAEYRMTRLRFNSVPTRANDAQTMLLYKLFLFLEVESRQIIEADHSINEENFQNIRTEYLNHAQQMFIKDSSVAKAQQGFSYQEHLVMLLSYLAKEDASDKDFSLIAEAMVPEAWNDIVLDWNEQLVFFQQKHRSLYSTSVAEMYSETDVLADKGDVSILKYYRAYRELKNFINDPHHPLYRYQNRLQEKNIRFIFFTNRTLPLANRETVYLKGEIDIQFKKIEHNEAPLIELKGFDRVIQRGEIWKITNFPAARLGLLASEQDELNDFLSLFYFFTRQKNAEDLFQHCKQVMQSPLGGFGQAVLADTFAHYVHRWFVTENPQHHVFDRKIITDFFNNHERYHYNLVNYSCYNYSIKEVDDLIRKNINNFKNLSCFTQIRKITVSSPLTIACQEPFLAATIIQEMFPTGERQIFTPFSSNINEYQINDKLKYAIIVGENNNLSALVSNIEEYNKKVKADGIRLIFIRTPQQAFANSQTLNIEASELEFLAVPSNDFNPLAIFNSKSSTACLTDFLFFAVTPLIGGLSHNEELVYVPQRLSHEEVILPYDTLKLKIGKWAENHKEEVNNSWVVEENQLIYKIQIELPAHLLEKSIQPPSSHSKFEWDDQDKMLWYIYGKKDLPKPVKYNTTISVHEMNLSNLEQSIQDWISNDKSFAKNYQDYPNGVKKIHIELDEKYVDELSSGKHWDGSIDQKSLYYYPYKKYNPKIRILKLNDFYSDRTISIIEAEAACGKTWYLRSKITLGNMSDYHKIPLFIRIKDMEKIRDMDDPIPELFDESALPEYLSRLAKQCPARFHLLLDGFDELPDKFLKKFEEILDKIISREYSITITVRDYQKNTLNRLTSSIIIQQRLNKFNGNEVKECLLKLLRTKLSVDVSVLADRVANLYIWMEKQASVSEWLGIPFHVALISEWYAHSSQRSVEMQEPSISDIYNFIVYSRIKRGSKKKSGGIYKVLERSAWNQIIGSEKNSSSFSIKYYNFKTELSFALERTGLTRNPYAESPELFHKTFAEFLVAKRLLRKLVGTMGKNNEFNIKLIRLLYHTEYRLVLHFFHGLFLSHHMDVNMPYELSFDAQNHFEQMWLTDFIGQKLNQTANEMCLVVWDDKIYDAPRMASNNLNKGMEINTLIHQCLEDKTPLKDFNKDTHRELLTKFFNAYSLTTNEEMRKIFHKKIRDTTIQLFLREDYPDSNNSIYIKYKSLDEFDIGAVYSAFKELESISSHYSWRSNSNSHVFKCWSEGGYKDINFAMPILDRIGAHLNIIHVLYIRLYVSHGGYDQSNDDRLLAVARNHINYIGNEENLRVIFSSILLFLSTIDDWTARQEYPTLPKKTARQLIKSFEKLLIADLNEINADAKLFVGVLFINFILYFKARMYLRYTIDNQEFPQVVLIFPNSMSIELNAPCDFNVQFIYQQIYQLFSASSQSTEIKRFDHLFDTWRKLKRNLLTKEDNKNSQISDSKSQDKKATFWEDSLALPKDSIKYTQSMVSYQEILSELNKNKTVYENMSSLQKKMLEKLPDYDLSDYQILTKLNKIEDTDPHKEIKRQLYFSTYTLFTLHHQSIDLQKKFPFFPEKSHAAKTTKFIEFKDQRVIFNEEPVVGDGWCTLNAIGATNPKNALTELKTHVKKRAINQYICRAIENNYQASFALKEEFNLEGMDKHNNSIKIRIENFYLNCQNKEDETSAQEAHREMLTYFSRSEVQIAYLDHLLTTKYVDSNIAAACLSLQQRKIALFIDYGLEQGKLCNLTEDNVDFLDENTVCLIFHPRDKQVSAHYNILKIKEIVPQNIIQSQHTF